MICCNRQGQKKIPSIYLIILISISREDIACSRVVFTIYGMSLVYCQYLFQWSHFGHAQILGSFAALLTFFSPNVILFTLLGDFLPYSYFPFSSNKIMLVGTVSYLKFSLQILHSSFMQILRITSQITFCKTKNKMKISNI